MPIEVKCSTCGATLPAPDEFAGKKIRCADCQAIVDVPATVGSAPPLPVAGREDRDDEPRARRRDDDDDRPSRRPKRDWDDDEGVPEPGQKSKVLAGGAIVWLLLLGLLSAAGLGLIGMALIPAKG